MIEIKSNDGIVIMPVAGRDDKGNKFTGETTNEIINQLFGDLVVGKLPTEEEFQSIINRCEQNKWFSWKESWITWKNEGILN